MIGVRGKTVRFGQLKGLMQMVVRGRRMLQCRQPGALVTYRPALCSPSVAALCMALVAASLIGGGCTESTTAGAADTALNDDTDDDAAAGVDAHNGVPLTYTEQRAPCTHRTKRRLALFGELHSHTAFSFDARSYDTLVTPAEAYRFARGEPVHLAPLDKDGKPTREAQLDRPLDFAAITDHGEFLGEIGLCTTKDSAGWDSEVCMKYRDPAEDPETGAFTFGTLLASTKPKRLTTIAAEPARLAMAKQRWQAMQAAAHASYDRTNACVFTAFSAYEYTNTRGVSNIHRNVIFRNDTVPDAPITLFEATSEHDLWRALDDQCANDGKGCDALSIGHNSNLSNGRYFLPTYEGTTAKADQQQRANLRARVEPLVEMFQHKGDMECRNNMPLGPDEAAIDTDPLCDFEKLRNKETEMCTDDKPGAGGMRLWGCLHRLDFVRAALKQGLVEAARLGVNPYRFGLIGATDTHNGTPGNTSSFGFPGHVGLADNTAHKRLGSGTVTHDGIINNPGGLAGVWAVENSRDAIFEAFSRRETFATSGTRIKVRLFGGWGYDKGLCGDADGLGKADDGGVPMGGVLQEPPAGTTAPTFFVQAAWDPGVTGKPGSKLSHLQLIKGWIDDAGKVHEKVVTVAGKDDPASKGDAATCQPAVGGHEQLCATWTDPDYKAGQRAFWYTRVIELPSCRWSTRECNALPAKDRPTSCSDAGLVKLVRQRAWSSAIWSQ